MFEMRVVETGLARASYEADLSVEDPEESEGARALLENLIGEEDEDEESESVCRGEV